MTLFRYDSMEVLQMVINMEMKGGFAMALQNLEKLLKAYK